MTYLLYIIYDNNAHDELEWIIIMSNLPVHDWNEESSINSVCSITWKVKSMPSSDVFVTSPQYKKWSLLTIRPLKSD